MEKIQLKNFFGECSLETNGARLYDRLTIRPMAGRKKVITLNRRSFEVCSSEGFGVRVDNAQIFLPGEKQDFSFSLLLIRREGRKGDEYARYLIKANTCRPFRINGVSCFEAFMERGDVVELSYNQLVVEQVQESQEENFPLEDEVISSGLDILLEGETGTGKSRLARIIHEKSGCSGPFVPINLSAFSQGVIESELFGHVKGAFTGALYHKRGAFLQAHGGTLFLDEIDSLSIDLQTKLLLFLDSKEFRPVGAEQSKRVEVKLIYASGQSLGRLVDKGDLRRDFYFRISSGVRIELPPLRENLDLLESLSYKLTKKHNKYLSSLLLERYKEFSWPGNIRQFLGHLQKKILLSKTKQITYDKEDEGLFFTSNFHVSAKASLLPLAQIKRNYVKKVHYRTGRDVARTAKILEISKATVRTMIKSL
jgi:transcriptional regulator with PAS, ATPase and Fis domain